MTISTRTPVVLLMTATITPPAGAPGLVRVDPGLRLEDYRRALAYYLKRLGRELESIVFVENSNSDVSPLRAEVARAGQQDRVEFLVYDGLDFPASYGRAHGEMRLLDHAMGRSELIRAAGPDCLVWKVTGRYKLRNLGEMIRRRPPAFDFYCDMRTNRIPWLDMRVMAWSPAGYEKILRGIYHELREDAEGFQGGENQMYHAVERRLDRGDVATAYLVEPLMDGVRGFDNKNSSRGRYLLIYLMRSFQRRLFRKSSL